MAADQPFDYPNEGTIIENPDLTCPECGYANLKLIPAVRNKSAAKCTICGAGFISGD